MTAFSPGFNPGKKIWTRRIVKVLRFALMAAIAVLAILVAAALTGRDRRAYSTLKPDERVTIARPEISVHDLAETYRPLMHIRPSTPSPPLLWIWYEAVPTDDSIDIVYYFSWDGEVGPSRIDR